MTSGKCFPLTHSAILKLIPPPRAGPKSLADHGDAVERGTNAAQITQVG